MTARLTASHSTTLRRWFFAALFALFLTAFCASPMRAAEATEANPADSPIGTLFRWLNFAVVFGGGAYLIGKHAPTFFRKRAEIIASGLTEAAKVKSEAEAQLREADHKLAHLDKEMAELRATSQREAAAEAERLRSGTIAEATKIARSADAEIEAAGRAARTELKALVTQLSIERARGLIAQQMTPDAQATLFRQFLGGLNRQGGQLGSVN